MRGWSAQPSARALADAALNEGIAETMAANRRVYASPRIHAALACGAQPADEPGEAGLAPAAKPPAVARVPRPPPGPSFPWRERRAWVTLP
jgi:hypothetical protein